LSFTPHGKVVLAVKVRPLWGREIMGEELGYKCLTPMESICEYARSRDLMLIESAIRSTAGGWCGCCDV